MLNEMGPNNGVIFYVLNLQKVCKVKLSLKLSILIKDCFE